MLQLGFLARSVAQLLVVAGEEARQVKLDAVALVGAASAADLVLQVLHVLLQFIVFVVQFEVLVARLSVLFLQL